MMWPGSKRVFFRLACRTRQPCRFRTFRPSTKVLCSDTFEGATGTDCILILFGAASQKDSRSRTCVLVSIRTIGVTEVTYYRWRQEFGGLKTDQVKRMKELEAENARLRRAVSDLTLDKMILAEAAKGNF